MQQYLSPREAAEYTSLSKSVLDHHRIKGTGPRYMREGSRVIYRRSDLDAYLEASLVGTVDQPVQS